MSLELQRVTYVTVAGAEKLVHNAEQVRTENCTSACLNFVLWAVTEPEESKRETMLQSLIAWKASMLSDPDWLAQMRRDIATRQPNFRPISTAHWKELWLVFAPNFLSRDRTGVWFKPWSHPTLSSQRFVDGSSFSFQYAIFYAPSGDQTNTVQGVYNRACAGVRIKVCSSRQLTITEVMQKATKK